MSDEIDDPCPVCELPNNPGAGEVCQHYIVSAWARCAAMGYSVEKFSDLFLGIACRIEETDNYLDSVVQKHLSSASNEE